MTDLHPAVSRLSSRWRTLVAVPAIAVAVALLVSLSLPKKYDATVTLLIQPGSSDPRFPQTLNQVYLEYLRSYEYVVQADDLIARVIREFRLDRDPYHYTVESFRRSALNVQLFRNTKLLSVRVRFEDPNKAHAIALFLAKEATHATEAWRDADAERAIRVAGQDADEARKRLAEAERQLGDFRASSHEDELQRAVQVDLENKSQFQRQLAASGILIAELEARGAAIQTRLAQRETKELRQTFDEVTTDLAAERAKLAALRRSLGEIEAPAARRLTELARVQSRATQLERAYSSARDALTPAVNRVNDARTNVAARSEQLQIADPGIVPDRPSSPHYLLNALVALALGLLAAIAAVSYDAWMWPG